MFKRLGSNLFKGNISFSDHPTTKRLKGEIQTYTFDGVLKYIKAKGLVSDLVEIK